MKHLPYLSLAAVYLGLAAPAFGEDTAGTVRSGITLADKVSCESMSPTELQKKNLTCTSYLMDLMLNFEDPNDSDAKLGAGEYGKAVVSRWLGQEKSMPSTLSAYLVGEAIRTRFIPLDINGDCYITFADDVNDDNRITLEYLTLYQATAKSTDPKVKCSYDPAGEVQGKKIKKGKK